MKLFVIADDVTGGNATAALLAKCGLKSIAILNNAMLQDDRCTKYDVISISTDSRGLQRDEAYNKVKAAVEGITDKNAFVAKRVDSTLRGNLGAEIDGALDGRMGAIAVVVASYPDSKRICVDGTLFVDGVSLEHTQVAKDPKCPVLQSRVKCIIAEQSKRPIGEIYIKDVREGNVAKRFLELAEKGHSIIVVDATTNEEIRRIAVELNGLPQEIIMVDPGPFTCEMMIGQHRITLNHNLYGLFSCHNHLKYSTIFPISLPFFDNCDKKIYSQILQSELCDIALEKQKIRKHTLQKKIFFSVGSASKNTIDQIQYLSIQNGVKTIEVNPLALIDCEQIQREINHITNEAVVAIQQDANQMIGIVTTAKESEILDLQKLQQEFGVSQEEISVRINQGLAEITKNILEQMQHTIGGLYTSGGDVTVATLKKLGVSGIHIQDEVVPLAVYGKIVGGSYDNMHIVTKGGLIGNHTILWECMQYLLLQMNTRE